MKGQWSLWLAFIIYAVLSFFVIVIYFGKNLSGTLRILGGGFDGGNEWNERLGFVVLLIIVAYFAFRAARRSSGANKNEKSESFDWLANKTSKLYDWFFVDAIAIYTIYLGLGIVLSSIFIISAWRLSMLFPSELFDSLMNIFTLNMIESSELRIVLSGLLWMLIAQGFCKLLRIDKVLEQMVRKRLHA